MITAVVLQSLIDELQNDERRNDKRGRVEPYPGLRPFRSAESHYFKGRAEQIEEIIQRLASDSCVVVLGGSGCGKSSIVRAGVIPALQLKMLPGRGDFWRVAICTPGGTPVTHLVDALDRLLEPDGSGERRKKIRNVLYGSDGLGGFLPAFKQDILLGPNLSPEMRDKANVLVLIDQFEELFREENRGKAEAADLVGFITDFWRKREHYHGFYLVLTMRTDDLHRCAEFIDLPEVINACGYLTRRLKETELHQAIVEPLRPALFRAEILQEEVCPFGAVDVRPYDVQVITELLDTVEEIAHDPDHLPLLQHLLAVLWRTTLERWQSEVAVCPEAAEPQITLQDLARSLGCENWEEAVRKRDVAYHAGVRGWLLRYCLEHAAEQLYVGSIYGQPLTDRQRTIARVAFCLMGEVDNRGSFKRRWTNRQEIAEVAGLQQPDADVEAVIHRFNKDHCLLTERQSGEIDFSHESLMRNWSRLGKQLEEDRDAGVAYRDLVERYAGWKKRQRQFWLSWLTQWFGLLPAHELERVQRLLEPRYNRYWAKRFISSTYQQQDAETTSTQRNNTLSCHDSAFLGRRNYLWRSVIRHWVALGMKCILGIAVVLIPIYVWLMAKQAERVKAHTETASFMWGSFGSWTPSMNSLQVDNLWKIVRSTPEFRSIFVRQLGKFGDIQGIGFRPQPMLRAVGLRWPDPERKVGLKAIGEIADRFGHEWDLAALACVVGVIDERIDPESKDRAVEVLSKHVRKLSAEPALSPQRLWSFTRMISCAGDQLDKLDKEVRASAMQAMQQAIASLDSSPSSFDVATANAIAMIVSYLAEKGPADPVALDKLKKTRSWVIEQTFQGLGGEQSGYMAQWMARPLASLLAALSPPEQREMLHRLLSFVATKNADEDLLLSLAQAVENLVESPAKGSVFSDVNPLEAWLNEDQNRSRLQGPAKSADDTVARLAMARFIAPLTQYQPMPTTVVDELLSIAEVGTSAANLAEATEILLQKLQQTVEELRKGSGSILEVQFDVAERLRLGLRGRLLAVLVTQVHGGRDDRAATVVEEAIERAMLRPPPSSFVQEGLARALAALAPKLQGPERDQALTRARQRLARTGSPTEAAAWSRVIVALLKSERDDHQFVQQIVEVLKYPTAALFDREPGVAEPPSATDILVKALRDRLRIEIPDGAQRRWDGGLHLVLDKIKGKKGFSNIDITTPPDDPRLNSGNTRQIDAIKRH